MTHETRDTYEEREGIPRWLKVVGLIALLVVLLVVVIVVTSGGGHRPQPHGVGDVSTVALQGSR